MIGETPPTVPLVSFTLGAAKNRPLPTDLHFVALAMARLAAGSPADALMLGPSASAAKLGSQLHQLLKTAEKCPKECGSLNLADCKVRCVALLLWRAAATR